jgi:hypothetical protein
METKLTQNGEVIPVILLPAYIPRCRFHLGSQWIDFD